MKQSKTTLKELTHRYRAVLLKCALLNLAAFAVAMPAKADTVTISAGAEDTQIDHTGKDVVITDGDFKNVSIVGNNFELKGGSFTDDITIINHGGYHQPFYSLSISDGEFNDAYVEAANISVSNGKFIRTQLDARSLGDLNLAGGDFKGIYWDGDNITIDTDKINVENGKSQWISAKTLKAEGNKGLDVSNINISGETVSGKLSLGKDSFIGSFDASLDKWTTASGKTIYGLGDVLYGSGPLTPNAQNMENSFSKANVTLNDNAQIGAGFINLSFPPEAEDYAAGNYQAFNRKLTDTEINESIDAIVSELTIVKPTSKSFDDMDAVLDGLSLAVQDSIYVPYFGSLKYSETPQLQEYIKEQWADKGFLDETAIKTIKATLTEAYKVIFNESFDNTSARVNIAKSEITMNGTAGLVNGSAKDGNIVVSDNSTVVANGTNEITAKSGTVSFADSKLVVSNGANLTVATKDGNTLNLTNGTVDLSGVLNGNVSGGTLAFNSANARLNGKIANTGVEINTDIGFSALPTGLTTLKIATGKTLDIGENNLTASTITGGTISAILTDAAKNTAIVTATASNVTLKLDMSQASRDKVTKYKITNGTGFTFGDYATNRYAVSASEFDKANAKTLEKLSGWNGGDLWILRLATASEAAIEDLEKSGVVLPENEKNASKILDLASGIFDKLPEHHKKVIDKVNDLLDKAQGKAEEIKQILREIAPDASTSGSKTASNTAKSVINVINSRFGGGSPRRGRSGGDYTVGQTAVWAQGMMNYAKLDTDNGFDAHSNGFAAGFEASFTDSFKAGLGYAYTSTDISTERSKTDVKTHTGFVYGEYKPNKAYINGVVSFGRSDYDDTTRSLSLTSAYKTDTIAAQIAAGYKAGVLTPEAAVRFTNVKQKAYTDATGAEMSEKTADTWTGVLGAKIGKNYVLRANRKIGLSPELKVAATYDFARDDENRTVTLPDGSSYTATGEAMERFGVEAGAGVTVSIANSAEIALTYDGKFKKDYQDHTGMVNLKIKF